MSLTRQARGWLGLLLALLLAGASVDAQVRLVRRGDDRLRGIQTVDLVIRVAPGGPAACGVSRPDLQSVSLTALREAGLRATLSEAASSWFHTVEVDLATMATGDWCVTSLSAELLAHVDGLPEADRGLPPGAWGSLLVGTMRLLRESALFASPPGDHAARAMAELRARVAEIATRIRKAKAEP